MTLEARGQLVTSDLYLLTACLPKENIPELLSGRIPAAPPRHAAAREEEEEPRYSGPALSPERLCLFVVVWCLFVVVWPRCGRG
ncbi:hypothetical protein EYF80_060546 [Liparis tanakae]|uniref:Uncharacterized protein n=1 Tax=Liparis tanakae TaxID=230148 RepID=A0A4Z2EK56_9TELE|nr:hypothetical protein EYF80_060546 [Liparis tanakae]